MITSYVGSFCRRLFKDSPARSHEEFPCFVFAASWRTGSTLLQRVITASGEIFVWGEPTFLPELAALYQKAEGYFQKVAWNRKTGFSDQVGKWVPVVSPSEARVRDSVGFFLAALYHKETLQMGFPRWGFKEVRAKAMEHMQLLADVYPAAKFIFLVRDPYDMYRSVKGKKFHANFPDPYCPVQVWNDNVRDFLNVSGLSPKCKLVRYEDLCKISRKDNKLLEEIAFHLGIAITEKMYGELESKTDSSGTNQQLGPSEIAEITRIVSETAGLIGYQIR